MSDIEFSFHTTTEEKLRLLNYFAALRIVFFRDYPYLYSGDFNYEKDYLNYYIADQSAVFLTASLNSNIIGFCSGASFLSMGNAFGNVLEKFSAKGYLPKDLYYLGEIIVKDNFANRILSKQLFKRMLSYSLELNFKGITFCNTLEPNFKSYSQNKYKFEKFANIFNKIGIIDPHITTTVTYNTVDSINHESEKKHTMKFWTGTYSEIRI